MDGGEAGADLGGDLAELVGGVAALRLLLADVRVQRLPGDLLHHQDGAPGARREVVDAADVGVADGAREQELLAQGLVVSGHARLFAHDLEGHGLLGGPVECQEHLAHPTFAEALADIVTIVDDRSGGDWRGRAGFGGHVARAAGVSRVFSRLHHAITGGLRESSEFGAKRRPSARRAQRVLQRIADSTDQDGASADLQGGRQTPPRAALDDVGGIDLSARRAFEPHALRIAGPLTRSSRRALQPPAGLYARAGQQGSRFNAGAAPATVSGDEGGNHHWIEPARRRLARPGKVRRRMIREPGDLLRRDRSRPPGWRDATAARRVRLAACPSVRVEGRSLGGARAPPRTERRGRAPRWRRRCFESRPRERSRSRR